MNGNDLRIQLGLSARNVSYWCDRGWIRPVKARPGSGKPLDFPDSEVAIAVAMLALINGGVKPDVAHRMARNPVAGIGELQLLIKALGDIP